MPRRALSDVVRERDTYAADASIFVPATGAVTCSSPVEVRGYGNEPAADEGLRYFISFEQVVDVVDSLAEQIANPSEEEIVTAVLYYGEHDAFIAFADP